VEDVFILWPRVAVAGADIGGCMDGEGESVCEMCDVCDVL
jgi:hypothetical protein